MTRGGLDASRLGARRPDRQLDSAGGRPCDGNSTRAGKSSKLELANHDLFYGKDGDWTGADRESQEVSMLAQHLLHAVSSATAGVAAVSGAPTK